jgi:formyl-CoA transferase
VIDLALYEAMFNLSESLLPEYDVFGAVRQPAGGALPGITPSNAYRCAGGDAVLIAGNGDSIFKRLMTLIGREDLGNDPQLAGNEGRSQRAAEIDAAIDAWTSTRALADVLACMKAAQVPASRIYTIAEIAADPHYASRGNIERIPAMAGGTIAAPGIVPKLSATPGAVRHAAPALGQHTSAVLADAGIDAGRLAALKDQGVIE